MTESRRLLLQSELEGYFEDDDRVSDPSIHVSFQPDEETQIKYPHIVYARDPAYKLQADNIAYRLVDKYVVTIIDREPDSKVFFALRLRPYCTNRANFIEDGLYHNAFDLYH